MRVKLTGNFVKTNEVLKNNYPPIYPFSNKVVEITGLRKGVLYMFFYEGEHYYGDRRYCTVEEIE